MSLKEKLSIERNAEYDEGDITSVEYGGYGKTDHFVKTPQERKVFWKINLAFIPLVCLILFIQFTDKSTLNLAAVMGIYEDTNITKTQFSWLGSIFYVGYLAFQLPNQYLMQRLPISKYLGVILVVWGVSLGCTALAKNFSHLAGLRFLLGFFEASTYPSIFLLISTFYRRSEQVIWFGTMFICNAVSMAVGGLIGYGIGFMDGQRGISAWKWSMIIWGSVTTLLGIFFFIFLPDKSKSRWFRLTPEEEKIVDQRTMDNAVVQNKKLEIEQIYEALKEPRYYAYFFISIMLNLQNGCLTIFSSQIIKDMGFTNLNSILLNIPYGAGTCVTLALAMFLSHHFNTVNIVGALSTLISLIGALLLVAIPSGGVRLLGLYIAATSPPYVILQTTISNNVAGYTKKIFYTGSNLVAYCIGNFVGPLMMVAKTAPRYIGGMSGYIAADFIAILLFLFVRWSLKRENARREALRTEGKIPPPSANRDELDLTDCQDLNFVYRP